MKQDLTNERPETGDRALLVCVCDDDVALEFHNLACAAGVEPLSQIKISLKIPNARYFIGKGKLAEIHEIVKHHDINLVFFDSKLSPAQERNLERFLHCRVFDRTTLILDIFAKRALSFEGKLQVELAQLRHLSTRLVRGWTHLERQKGGIGLRGPGETQLETDRRLIRKRIKIINDRLNKVEKQRHQQRTTRRKKRIPTISLVGYTNAGKTTLFNKLTQSESYAADQLFATLDPVLRKIKLPLVGNVILADTVGFISDLPHELIKAFHATLQETQEASLLLHVIDVSHADYRAQKKEVEKVLQVINADQIPQIEVYNKIDCCSHSKPQAKETFAGYSRRVWISAKENKGIDLLVQALMHAIELEFVACDVRLKPHEGKTRSQLYALGAVLKEKVDEDGDHLLSIRISRREFMRLFPGG